MDPLQKLEELRYLVEEGLAANFELTKEEDQEFTLNSRFRAKLERKKEEALAYLEKQQAAALGLDLDRSKHREYTQEETEAWRVRQEEKSKRADPGFTDWAQMAHRKYARQADDIRPQEILSRKPEDNLKILQEELDQTGKQRRSRRKRFDPTADVTYINQRNLRFNQKLARAYDAVTAEIKDNLERGTAL